MTLAEIYQSSGTDGIRGETARALLAQTHWFTLNADFDPKTGDALPQALSTFLAKVANPGPQGKVQDRLYRITEHARPAVERLFRTLNESPRREQALLPVHAARELDAGSFIKLSTRPGRNIREKLAGKPYLQAVRRFQSVNLPENRLLKSYVSRLADLLELRRNYLREGEDELLPRIRSWLLSEEAKSIGHWDNLPPNNTLLSHRDYRRVWDAWRRLQTLDDDIARDLSRLNFRGDTMQRWVDYSQMYREGTFLFAEMPVLFDYEEFTIQTWNSEFLVQKSAKRIGRSREKRVVAQPICIDLAESRPHFAVTPKSAEVLTENFLWQEWKDDAETVDIALFDSDAAYLHDNATTIASTDLFFAGYKSPELLDRAALSFAVRLRESFVNDALVWLVPDLVNDFELGIIRRNLNTRFPGAQPLPRSVAAVFEHFDYARITNDGYAIVVVDTIGGKTCATKLLARFDQDLEERLPETRGYCWERCPSVIIPSPDSGKTAVEDRRYNMITVDANGQWLDTDRPEGQQFIDPQTLKSDPHIGQFESYLSVTHSPVVGGIRLYALQERAAGIPLWRDQIPELSIKVMKEGWYQRFYLVSRGTTVRPIRGLSVPIPVEETFTLPSGKSFYPFPLFQGEKANELGFSARLDSPAFPLKHDTECKLNLTFEYGADEPYCLIFSPVNRSFPPVRATWRRAEETAITDAPAPVYPTPKSWAELRRVPKLEKEETHDLLEWVLSAIDSLVLKRTVGEITDSWRKDKNGNHYTFARCDSIDTSVFIHEDNFVKGLNYEDFNKSDVVSFELDKFNGRVSGKRIARSDYTEEFDDQTTTDLVKRIHSRLYFPFIQVWRDGRSLSDDECPEDFANAAKNRIEHLNDLLSEAGIPLPIKNEFLFLLSCLHKDTTDDCVKWIKEQVESGNIRDPRAIGFALGDLTKEWQQDIFNNLASKINSKAISVFAYAIWRDQHFVERLSILELNATLNVLSQRLEKINSVKLNSDRHTGHRINPKWVRVTVLTLELLLGLLRTRASADPEKKMLLQPHQKITKEFAKQVERLTEIVAHSKVTLFSRLQLNIQKPECDFTPDLLYALRLYLTGDDGANAIYITSISDNDND